METWQNYEEIALFLIDKFRLEFGLEFVEGKQMIEGLRSGTKWEIEGKGIRDGTTGIVIIECRRYTTSRLDQESLCGLAYRILDTSATGGIVVSPLPLQKGARKIAAAENVVVVRLNENSTPYKYMLSFLNKVMAGVQDSLQLNVQESARVKIL